jgi:K+-transporting ATPase ATPase B chain
MTRLSGVDIGGGRKLRKGAIDSVLQFARQQTGGGGAEPPQFRAAVDKIARSGGTPLALADGGRLLGVIHLKDVVKPDVKERFAELRRMGIKTVMITGDNPITAASIASEAGVDDFIAEATPEDKLRYIRDEQARGRLIAMCGDGTNDAPALAQADVDVAKYFAIIPAMFVAFYPQLQVLNVMGLSTPQSAILSAIIFNALIIIALIPLALKGVRYRPIGAAALLRRNLLVYGVGGIVLPFVGIKAIDLAVTALHLA